MWDAIVAGAGPAGAVAAYELARSGRRVLLADAVDPTSSKIGEALPGAAVRLLRSIELPVPGGGGPHTPIGGNLSSWNSDQLVANDFIRDPDGPGWRLDRARFDADLRAAALRAGASYRSARVTDLERKDTGWHIRFKNGGTEMARWIVDATGRRAAIARRLGARRLRDAPLVAVYASGTSATGFALNRTVIEAVPRGWWYAARLTLGRGACRLSYASRGRGAPACRSGSLAQRPRGYKPCRSDAGGYAIQTSASIAGSLWCPARSVQRRWMDRLRRCRTIFRPHLRPRDVFRTLWWHDGGPGNRRSAQWRQYQTARVFKSNGKYPARICCTRSRRIPQRTSLDDRTVLVHLARGNRIVAGQG
jgi:hypothetical protein